MWMNAFTGSECTRDTRAGNRLGCTDLKRKQRTLLALTFRPRWLGSPAYQRTNMPRQKDVLPIRIQVAARLCTEVIGNSASTFQQLGVERLRSGSGTRLCTAG